MDTSLTLLERLAGEPVEADWRRLVDLYEPLLRSWIARAGISNTDADDLTQEVLLVIVREVACFERRGPGAFRSWLRVILAHRLHDFFRKRQKHVTGQRGLQQRLDELQAPQSALSRLWDREHDTHLAARALERVRPDFTAATWEAFRRHVLDGEPAPEVARNLGVALNVVLLAKSRVLKRLREELRGLVG